MPPSKKCFLRLREKMSGRNHSLTAAVTDAALDNSRVQASGGFCLLTDYFTTPPISWLQGNRLCLSLKRLISSQNMHSDPMVGSVGCESCDARTFPGYSFTLRAYLYRRPSSVAPLARGGQEEPNRWRPWQPSGTPLECASNPKPRETFLFQRYIAIQGFRRYIHSRFRGKARFAVQGTSLGGDQTVDHGQDT